MILVDSSVWIDAVRGRITPTTRKLRDLIGKEPVLIGDLMIAEVLQGCDDEEDFRQTQARLDLANPIVISNALVAVQAARHYRHLRSLGITVRKTIDTLIATRCILDDLPLLFSDRDFEPFVAHLGLRDAMAEPV